MPINDFIDDAERSGSGQWVKLLKKGDRFEGTLVDIEVRPRTDPKGEVVLTRKTHEPRKIYRVTVKVPSEGPEDEGFRLFDANEGAQSAIRAAYKAVGTKNLKGGIFKIRVTADRPDEYSQVEYEAKFEPPLTVDLPDDGDPDEEPF